VKRLTGAPTETSVITPKGGRPGVLRRGVHVIVSPRNRQAHLKTIRQRWANWCASDQVSGATCAAWGW
jgi:hypothetical protein